MKKLLLSTILALALTVVAKADAYAAGFSWGSGSAQTGVNTETTVNLSINTDGQQTTGADVLLQFDPSKVAVQSVTFSPNVYSRNFHNIGNGTVRLTSSFTDVASHFSGSASYAQITFKPLVTGSSTVSFLCSSGATNDTNILLRGTGADIVNCGSLASLTVTGTSGGGGNNNNNNNNNNTNNTGGGGNNTDGGGGGSNTNQVAGCAETPPGTPFGFTATPINRTSVHLRWPKIAQANNYSIRFGTSPGSYTYGASNIGNTDQFVVNFLKPGTTYYFALHASRGCATSDTVTAQARTLAASSRVAARPVPSNIPSSQTPIIPEADAFFPAPTEEAIPTFIPEYTPYIAATLPPVAPTPVPQRLGLMARLLTMPYLLILIILLILFILFILWKRRRDEENTPPQMPPYQPPVQQPPMQAPPTQPPVV